MPVNPTYPGVYVEELPSGVRPIVGVSTSITAFVGRFLRGPHNAALRVLDLGAFERDFGGLWRPSPASYAVQQFFLNGGTEAVIVRVGLSGAPPFTAATLPVPAAGGGNAFTLTAGRRIRGATVPDPGSWGNLLRFEVDYTVDDPTAGDLFNLTVHELQAASGRLAVRTTETIRNVSLTTGHRRAAEDVVNAGSKLVQVSGVTAGALADVTGTLTGPVVAAPTETALTVAISNSVDATQDLAPVAVTVSLAGVGTDLALYRAAIEAAIRSADPNDARISGATVEMLTFGGATRFRVLTGRRGNNFHPDDRLLLTGLVAANDLQMGHASARQNVQMRSLAGGQDGIAVTDAELVGSLAAKEGLFALEDADIFNLLAIPEAGDLPPAGMGTVYSQALGYCRDRRAFLLVDIPETVRSVDAMQTWMTNNANLRSDHAAVFFPRPRVPDALEENRLKSRAASGTLAGVFARTDAERGVWKAPAGTEARLRNVPELDYLLTDGENGVLNPLGINCLRNLPVTGNVSWGARTLDGADVLASQWKYVPVRRVALFIEESLYRGLQWVVFEPNDEPLWAQIRLNVGAFMHDLFRKGAFQGSTPRDAYLVQCDASTTPQSDIDKGIVNVIVGFAPLKPAEFVILKIRQLAGQTPA